MPGSRSGQNVDVIVVGAGFAGLSAATALVEAGARVHVLEARPALGGRATAFRDPVTGERIDNGQHVLAGCYTETLSFLRRIGSADRLHRPSALRLPMIDEDGRRSVLAFPPLPSPLHLLAGVAAWDGLTASDRFSVLRMHRALRNRIGPQDGISVRQWLEQHRQSSRLCRMLWEPLALATLNQGTDEASARLFFAVVSRMFGPEPEASALLFPAVPLDELYAQPSRVFLESVGSHITTNAPSRVVTEQGKVVGAQVRDELILAPVVVSAVPWFGLADLFIRLPPELETIVTRATNLASSPIVTVNLWLTGPQLDEQVVGLPGRTFQWVFDKRRLVGSSQSHLSLVSSGAESICAMSNHSLIELALSELGSAIPSTGRATVRHASVVRERWATFSTKDGSPARPTTETPIRGLFLAGDWIETGLPATIESAVLSGHRAARAVLGEPSAYPSAP